MKELSETELTIAELYCHGLTDKEVADRLDKPVWTIRTHKKHIHSKLSISTTHELVLYMVARALGKEFDLRELRRRGLASILTCLMLFHIAVSEHVKYFRYARRVRIEIVERRGRLWQTI